MKTTLAILFTLLPFLVRGQGITDAPGGEAETGDILASWVFAVDDPNTESYWTEAATLQEWVLNASPATNGFLRLDEHATAPATPAAGSAVLYVKADGLFYSKDDAGTETLVSGGEGGGGGGAFTADADTQITPTTPIVLDQATGDEIALNLAYTTNKASSGNDTGLVINRTDTASPGTSYLLDAQVGGTTQFAVGGAVDGIFGNGTVGWWGDATEMKFRQQASTTIFAQLDGSSSPQFRLQSDGIIGFSNSATTSDATLDTFISRVAAFNLGVGSAAATDPHQLHIFDGGADNESGQLVLYDDGGNAYRLWVDTAGVLRFVAGAMTDDDTDGAAIGSVFDPGDIAADLLPDADSTRDIGALANRWANIYADNLDLASVTTDTMNFSDQDASPTTAGEILYDNTITNLDEGALVFHDGTEARIVVDIPADTTLTNGYKVSYNAATDEFELTEDATAGAPTIDTIGDAAAATTVLFDDTETVLMSGASDGEAFWTLALTDADLAGDTYGLRITAVDNDDANYIPFQIRDDSGGDDDLLFQVGSTGSLTISEAAHVIGDSGGSLLLDPTGGAAVVDGTLQATGLIADTLDGNGAVDIDIGSADITDVTVTTDGTGTAEVVLPAGAIDGTEILDDTIDSADYAAGSIDNEHLAANSVDSDQYVDGSIDNVHLADDAVDSDELASGSVDGDHLSADARGQFSEIITGGAAPTLSISAATGEGFGSIHYVSQADTVTLPAVADGCSFTIVTIGAIAVTVDVNASDGIMLDGSGTFDTDGDSITNSSTAGDMVTFTYYSATGWLAISDGNWTAN